MSMAGLMETDAPPPRMEVSAPRLDCVGLEECLRVVGRNDVEYPTPETLEGSLCILAGHTT